MMGGLVVSAWQCFSVVGFSAGRPKDWFWKDIEDRRLV